MRVLTSVVSAVCSDFKMRQMYAEQHKDALAVGPVLGSTLVNAEHVGQQEVCRRPSKHWDLSISPPVPVLWRSVRLVCARRDPVPSTEVVQQSDCVSSATWGA